MTKKKCDNKENEKSYYWVRWTPHDSPIDYDALEAYIKQLNEPYLIVQEKKTKQGKRCPVHYHMWIKLSVVQKSVLKKLLDPNKTGNKTLSMPMAEDQHQSTIVGLVSYAYKDSSSHVRYEGIPKVVIDEGQKQAEEIKKDKAEKKSIYKRLQDAVYPIKDLPSELPHEAKIKSHKIVKTVGQFFEEYEGMSTQFMIKGYIETFCYKYVTAYRRSCLLRYLQDVDSLIDYETQFKSVSIKMLD